MSERPYKSFDEENHDMFCKVFEDNCNKSAFFKLNFGLMKLIFWGGMIPLCGLLLLSRLFS